MERISNNIPSSITVDIEASPKISQSNSNNGYFSTNGNTNYTRIGMIVLILLFLGVNIFSYLGDFLQIIKEALAPLLKNILESLGYVVTESTKDVTQVAAAGAKLGIDVAAGTVESGINVIQGQLDINQGSVGKQQPSQSSNKYVNTLSSSLSSALADAEYNSEPIPDDATSSTQRIGSGKSGYCYIGEDRGFRSCIQVKDGDVCMSGDIFPSQSICVNPSLRE
jgi:hypothetical protein